MLSTKYSNNRCQYDSWRDGSVMIHHHDIVFLFRFEFVVEIFFVRIRHLFVLTAVLCVHVFFMRFNDLLMSRVLDETLASSVRASCKLIREDMDFLVVIVICRRSR